MIKTKEKIEKPKKALREPLPILLDDLLKIDSEITDGQIVAFPIALDEIFPSEFEPQANRRKHFKQSDLEELAASIKTDGLFSPITVRPKNDKLEIVCGERRWLAMELAGYKTIPCFIKNISDKAAFDIQTKENLQRKEPDQLDLAISYQYYIEHFGMTVDDLAAQYDKDKGFITKILKLNNLIPSAVQDYYDGYLPIGHAKVICTHSAKDQMFILSELTYFENYKRFGVYSLADLRLNIRDEITMKLSTAHFDTEDERLHLKGLKCSQCPERTGYTPKLYDDDFGNEDRCLNKSCFEVKTNTYRRLQQIEIAENAPNPENKPIEEIIETVPFVTEKAYVSDPKIKEKVLTNQEFLPEKECDYAILTIVADGERKNEKVWVCNDNECPVHNPLPAVEELTETERVNLKREFNLKVNNAVRLRILKDAMESFDDYNIFWQFDDLIRQLIVNSLVKNAASGDVFKQLLKGWKNAPKSFDKYEDIEKFSNSLDKRQQSQILFLLANIDELKAAFFESSNRIEKLQKLTTDYTKLDYKRVEAQTIVALAPDEFREEAEQYLVALDVETPPQKPQMWIHLPEDKNVND